MRVLTNAWYLGARNGWTGANTSSEIYYAPVPLIPDAVYNFWIDVENKPLGEFASDTFTVYLQKEGAAPAQPCSPTTPATVTSNGQTLCWAEPHPRWTSS